MSIASRINEMTEHLRNDWGSIDKLGLKAKKLPDEYTQVDYIESHSAEYIDTGVNADINLDINLDINASLANVNGITFGAIYNNNGSYIRYHTSVNNDKYTFYILQNETASTISTDINVKHKFYIQASNRTVVVDNTSYILPANTNTDTNLSFWLFSRNSNSSNLMTKSSFKLYSCQMYYNNELVRDFIPCYRNSDNEVGLYDTVNDVFYTNQGTGVFTYGEIQEEISNKNIKNIAPVLNRFYNQSSDKTDLAKNGVVGKTIQDGDPTPENPVEINNLSGDVKYKVSGKNKLPFPYTEISHTKNGITYTINDDGTVLVNGTATAQSDTKLYGNYQEANNKEPIGKYLYGGTNEVRIRALNHTDNSYTVLATDTGNGTEIDTSVYKKYYIEISVLQGVTVNNVLIKPMVLDSLDDLKYEPYISESFPLSLKSRNLFDKDNANVLDGYINYVAEIISERNDKMIYIPCKPNTTYILQKMVQEPLNMNRFRVATSETEPTYGMTVNQFYNPGDGKNIEKYIITTNDKANYLIFYCYYALNNTVTFEEILDSIQISKISPYEPYYDIELCNISDYKDRIYSQNGKFYLEKKTVKVVLDGSRNWTKSGNTNIDRFVLSGYVDYGDTNCFSNYFANETYSDSNYNKSKIFLNTYSNTKRLIINFNTVGTTSLSDFKTWLSTHNTVVYYVLATPTTEKITSENYPTLYSQLQAIQEFLTKYKINKEFLLDYSSPEIEY